MPTTNYWGLRDIAEYLGVRYSSARTYHGRAEINRRRGNVRPGDMPAPDTRYGNSPVWEIEHIVMWKNSIRPGKGTGGGRPRGSIVLVRQECPVCGHTVGVTKDGLLYRHRSPTADPAVEQDYCEGSRVPATEEVVEAG